MTSKIRVILLGNTNVGKSTLLYKMTKMNHLEPESSTIGVNFGVIFYDKYKMLLWDTAGQERFRSIVSSYYRNIDVFVMVFSIENIKSFNDIDRWFKEVQRLNTNPNSSFILIGNKTDLEEKRKVDKKDIQEKAKQYDCVYIEVSCIEKCSYNYLLDLIVKQYEEYNNMNKNIDSNSLLDGDTDRCCTLQ